MTWLLGQPSANYRSWSPLPPLSLLHSSRHSSLDAPSLTISLQPQLAFFHLLSPNLHLSYFSICQVRMDKHYRQAKLPRSSQQASQYDILQPPFKQPPRPIPPRDRYRATQYEDPMYDVVEDDIADGLGSQLDSFGIYMHSIARNVVSLMLYR